MNFCFLFVVFFAFVCSSCEFVKSGDYEHGDEGYDIEGSGSTLTSSNELDDKLDDDTHTDDDSEDVYDDELIEDSADLASGGQTIATKMLPRILPLFMSMFISLLKF